MSKTNELTPAATLGNRWENATDDPEDLSPEFEGRLRRLAECALILGMSRDEQAAELGVNRVTLWRWSRHPAYRRIVNEVVSQAPDPELVLEAWESLRTALRSGPNTASVKAAVEILDRTIGVPQREPVVSVTVNTDRHPLDYLNIVQLRILAEGKQAWGPLWEALEGLSDEEAEALVNREAPALFGVADEEEE